MSVTVPLVWKPTEYVDPACTLPLACTLESTAPRCTVVVRGAADALLDDEPTTRYPTTASTTTPTPSAMSSTRFGRVTVCVVAIRKQARSWSSTHFVRDRCPPATTARTSSSRPRLWGRCG